MHKYLRAVGFSKIKSRKDLNNLIVKSVKASTVREYTSIEDDVLYSEYYAKFGERIGLCIRGEYTEDNTFSYDYFFPYLEGTGISTCEDISVEQRIENLVFSGVVDDYKIGVSIIFYLQGIITFLKLSNEDRLPLKGTSLTLSALSVGGKILLPIGKTDNQREKANRYNLRKNRMIAQAKQGDTDAMESLTIQDMDTYTVIHQKMKDEDLYSLVDTCFMPFGVECDLYAIIGEITDIKQDVNTFTKERVYILTLDVNDMEFDICINTMDLVGEPEIGRRFKGVIWLQGKINFPDNV